MRVIVVTGPTPVVTWEEADRHLKLDGDTTQKAEVEAFIAAATQHLDGPNGWLGRAIGQQTLEARFDNFGCRRGLFLPFPPVVSITSLKYLDTNGTEQTIDPADYDDFGANLVPAPGFAWPSPQVRRECVRVRYVAGYAEVPAPIKAATLMIVGDLYKHRETVTSDTVNAVPMSATVANLLQPFRVFT